MTTITVQQQGDMVGVTFPAESMQRLGLKVGQEFTLIELADGFQLIRLESRPNQTTETPTAESVRLPNERVAIEGQPITRLVDRGGDDAWKHETLTTKTGEKAVAFKDVRVREEIALREESSAPTVNSVGERTDGNNELELRRQRELAEHVLSTQAETLRLLAQM